MVPIVYEKGFIENPNELADILWAELDWERREKIPRYEYYCNEVGTPYSYGVVAYARTYEPKQFHPVILQIKEKLETFTGTKFEVCFLNGYADQSDHLGWHSDNSPEMDDSRPIAIISLGVEREIWFREIGIGEVAEKVKLENGSLCLMKPGMQDTHQHRIPKASFMCGKRISLTFRGYVNDE